MNQRECCSPKKASKKKTTAKKITKEESKRLIVVATIKSIEPLFAHSSDSDPMTVAVDRMAYGQSYLVTGTLDDYIIEKNPNN